MRSMQCVGAQDFHVIQALERVAARCGLVAHAAPEFSYFSRNSDGFEIDLRIERDVTLGFHVRSLRK